MPVARKWIVISIVLLLLLLIGVGTLLMRKHAMQDTQHANKEPSSTPGFSISSTAFQNNQPIPSKYTCQGADISPPLDWMGIPTGTKSLALIVHDPDAPGGDFVHWIVWDIPPTVTGTTENTEPTGMQGVNDFGKNGWGGPCPPSGTHHYVFDLYALNENLMLPGSSGYSELQHAMAGHMIGKTSYIGLFS